MNRLLTMAAAGAGAYWAYRELSGPGARFFRDKTVLITGGSRGLGLLLARQLANAGARVAICARDTEELARAFDDLSSRGTQVVAAECDVTDRDSVREFVGVARGLLGPIDMLINNAGLISVGPIEDQLIGDYADAMRTHYWGSLYAALEVIPEMRARRSGRIVNITSIGGKIAVPHMLPYTASKFALVGLSEGLRAELAQHNVKVTTIVPGLMRTGSHLNAEFKGRFEEEYAWFALGDSLPGVSINANWAAHKILRAAARGDAKLVITLPAKLAVALHGLFPAFTSDLLGWVNRNLLPEPGGVGPWRVRGRYSRGKLPGFVTLLSDRAAKANNEAATAEQPAATLPVSR
jgi:NAD(P)-dependent dehydrogenase (short-subunit alcohol dehydrogenase family)